MIHHRLSELNTCVNKYLFSPCRYEEDDDEGAGDGRGGADGPQLVESWLDEHYKKRNWQVRIVDAP